MRCYWRLLDISYKNHVNNEEALKKRSKQPLENIINSDSDKKNGNKVGSATYDVFLFSKDDTTGQSNRRSRGRRKRKDGKTVLKSGQWLTLQAHLEQL